jgi:hypothetical protein
MKTNQRRITLTLSAAAGGLLAAALLPMAVAFADEYDFTPDTAGFDPTQVEGYPPLINEVTGTDIWALDDATTSAVVVDPALTGVDTQTTIGSFTNNDFLTNNSYTFLTGDDLTMPAGTQIDLANFGGGFENEWIDLPGSGPGSGMSDLLITPLGDFAILGSFFSDIS